MQSMTRKGIADRSTPAGGRARHRHEASDPRNQEDKAEDLALYAHFKASDDKIHAAGQRVKLDGGGGPRPKAMPRPQARSRDGATSANTEVADLCGRGAVQILSHPYSARSQVSHRYPQCRSPRPDGPQDQPSTIVVGQGRALLPPRIIATAFESWYRRNWRCSRHPRRTSQARRRTPARQDGCCQARSSEARRSRSLIAVEAKPPKKPKQCGQARQARPSQARCPLRTRALNPCSPQQIAAATSSPAPAAACQQAGSRRRAERGGQRTRPRRHWSRRSS